MNRNDFLKIIGTGGASFILSGFGSKDLLYDLQEITIYDNYIRGTNFYLKDFKKLKVVLGQTLELLREQDNQYDSFAIAVLANKVKIGYVPAYENVVLANMMDNGVRLAATVSEINDLGENQYAKNIVGVKITTRLLVPMHQPPKNNLSKERADKATDLYRSGNL